MEKINKVCKAILKITDAEIAECEQDIQGQINHVHPLKIARQHEINEMCRHNLAVIEHLKKLRGILIAGNPSK